MENSLFVIFDEIWPKTLYYSTGTLARFRLVADVSGSMYRFNGYDSRLDRTLEAVLMVIESYTCL